MSCIRDDFVKRFFNALRNKDCKYCVIRGYIDIFDAVDKDIDIMMNPSDFERAKSIFSEICLEMDGVELQSSVSAKSLYLKLILTEIIDGKIVFNGVYVHAVAYLTIKTKYGDRNKKFVGEKVWLSDTKVQDVNFNNSAITVSTPKYELFFLLARYSQRQKKSYFQRINDILREKNISQWLKDVGLSEQINSLFETPEEEVSLESIYLVVKELYYCLFNTNSSVDFHEIKKLALLNIFNWFKIGGRLIFFSGPDGSGKTSANELLTGVLRNKLKVKVLQSKHIYPISRITSSKGQVLQAKLRGIDKENKDEIERDRGAGYQWYLRRLLGLIYLLVQVYPGFLWARYKNWQGVTVIIDTSCFDAFMKGHRPVFPLLERLVVPLIPCGDAWFVMTSSPETIVKRKPELTRDEIAHYYERLDAIVKYSKCKPIAVESDQGVAVAVETIFKSL